MEDRSTRNERITREFRENGGKVGGSFENATIVLLHTTGAKTGQERVTPLVAQPLEGGRYAIFASHGGAPKHPDWFHNLCANPHVTYEVGTRTVHATGRLATGEERERIWSKQKRDRPYFADYEKKTTREIPVIVLEPVRGEASNRTRPLTADELRRLLEEPLVASVGCLDDTGAPYVVPSWFEYDGESFWLVPRARSAWARHLQRDGRVCVSIDQRAGGSARVQVLGTAEIVEVPNVGGAWVPIATRMAARYLGPERGPAYLVPTLDRPRWLIRVHPHRITSWAGGGWHPRYVEG